MENPIYKWKMTGSRSTPIFGNLQISTSHPVVMDDHVSIETHGGLGIAHDSRNPNGLLYSVG